MKKYLKILLKFYGFCAAFGLLGYLMIFIIALLSSCATTESLHARFFDIKEGTSAQEILNAFGKPDIFVPMPHVEHAEVWAYRDADEACIVMMKKDIAIFRKCGRAERAQILADTYAECTYTKSEGKPDGC